MKLGRYEIVRELGKGAMGIVYLAKDPVIGRLVALKTIRLLEVDDDEEAREHQQRFIREAQAAGILSHPSIVTVHDIGQADEGSTSFIAMQYVEGPNLKELIQRGERPDYPKLTELIAQIADALDYAHERGIIHRDVKPANIILAPDGMAKITDFGIAKIASIASNLTTTGQFIGTPNYMSPEQVKGGTVDGRSDLFSLGIVLYETVTGRKPFAGDSLTTISYKIVHEPFPPLREAAPDAPEDLEPILSRLLAKEPAERYQRGSELALDLRRVRRRLLEPWATSDDPLLGEATVFTGSDTSPTQRARAAAAPALVGLRHVLRKRIAWPFALGIVLLALAAVAIPAALLHYGRVPEPVVDVEREKTMKQIRALRMEGQSMLESGNVSGGYQRFKEIQRLRPSSPANNALIARLETVLSEHELQQRQTEDAQRLFEEGKGLYARGRWEESIRRFEESFALNPSEDEVINYLRMAREQLNLADMRRQIPIPSKTAEGGAAEEPAPRGTATLKTNVTSTVADGYVLVRVGGRTILHENLWMERRGIIRRRVTRNLEISSTVPSGSQEVEVWIVIPSRGINTRRTLRHDFSADGTSSLTVNADPNADRYDVNIT